MLVIGSHFHSLTGQCFAIAKLALLIHCHLFSALPSPDAAEPYLFHAFPLRVCAIPMLYIAWLFPRHALPSRTVGLPCLRIDVPLPCAADLCLFISKLSPCYALFLHSMPLLINAARTPPLRLIAMLCHSSDILRLAIAVINSALPSQCFTSPRSASAGRHVQINSVLCLCLASARHCFADHLNAFPSPCTVTLNYSIPLPNIALALPYYDAPRLCDHSIAIPLHFDTNPLLCLSPQN